MERSAKIVLLCLLLVTSPSAYSLGLSNYPVVSDAERKDNTTMVDVLINSTMKVRLMDIQAVGQLEIYSILGVKVKSLSLRECEDGCNIDLPKGVYIIKAGKTTKKVMVK